MASGDAGRSGDGTLADIALTPFLRTEEGPAARVVVPEALAEAIESGQPLISTPTPTPTPTAWVQTTQADFQAGTRSGVDTYETPGSVTLLSLNDDFDDEVLNLDRWQVLQSPPDNSSVSEQGGAVTVSVNTIGQLNSLSLRQGVTFGSDFDVQVDFELLRFSVNHKTASLHVRSVGGTSYWYVGRSYYDRQVGYIPPGDYYLFVETGGSVVGGTEDLVDTTDTAGKLRLVRSGTTLTAYYWSGSGWTQISSPVTGASGELFVQVVTTNSRYEPGENTEVRYDNFQFNVPSGYMGTGVFESASFDTGGTSDFGTLSWDSALPGATELKTKLLVV